MKKHLKFLMISVVLLFLTSCSFSKDIVSKQSSVKMNSQNFVISLSAVYELIIEKNLTFTFEWQGNFNEKTSTQLTKGKYFLIVNSFSYKKQNFLSTYIIGQGLTAGKSLSIISSVPKSCKFFLSNKKIVKLNKKPLILLKIINEENQSSTLIIKSEK